MVEIGPVSLRDLRRGLEVSVLVDGSADGDGSWYAAADESFLQGCFKCLLVQALIDVEPGVINLVELPRSWWPRSWFEGDAMTIPKF